MDRRHLLTLGIGAAIGGAGCDRRPPPSVPTGPVVAKLADTVHPSNPSVAAERYFAEQVATLTQDRYRIDVAAGGLLGDDSRVNEMVRTGQIAFAKTLVNNLSAYDKRLGVLTLPFAFSGEQECMAALNGELGRRCTAILDESGLIVLAYFYAGERSLYNGKRPIHTPADVQGLRIRVPQSIVSIDIVNAMGGSAVPMANNEILSALQEQVVHGAENNPVFYLTEGHALYAPYYSRTRHQQSIDVLIASRKWLSEQPADVQGAIREAGRRTQTEEIRLWRQGAARAAKRAKDEGAIVNDVDIAAFRRVLAPVVREHRGTFGDLASLLPDA
ncbi:TRAP transporter substrate-binding protein DctP [Paractinoplanes rishiriensis]|uniref:C4-dicarboxylate ABC transporter n=1 Tax=Paractinoplanes rishiriensis TaxID=1050105 RepID=A0A919MV57_9ACTN|nr:TRAP transporter substrate-binding protein DctP [Actinoplanes rishiriensis]GIF01032.1 hypothetical protein Ari01nite_84960 [Actinoplanes rishiriensis]